VTARRQTRLTESSKAVLFRRSGEKRDLLGETNSTIRTHDASSLTRTKHVVRRGQRSTAPASTKGGNQRFAAIHVQPRSIGRRARLGRLPRRETGCWSRTPTSLLACTSTSTAVAMVVNF